MANIGQRLLALGDIQRVEEKVYQKIQVVDILRDAFDEGLYVCSSATHLRIGQQIRTVHVYGGLKKRRLIVDELGGVRVELL